MQGSRGAEHESVAWASVMMRISRTTFLAARRAVLHFAAVYLGLLCLLADESRFLHREHARSSICMNGLLDESGAMGVIYVYVAVPISKTFFFVGGGQSKDTKMKMNLRLHFFKLRKHTERDFT